MPIVFIKNLDSHTRLGLWRMDEEVQMEDVCPPFVCIWLKEKCQARQRETIATYALLREMTGRDDLFIAHEQSGRPYLKMAEPDAEKPTTIKEGGRNAELNIGVSHTRGYASVIISNTRNVAVDIEYRSDRVRKIANRFLREDEQGMIERACSNEEEKYGKESTYSSRSLQTRLLLHWCAKETVFKFYSDERLTFQNMRVEGITDIRDEGDFRCKNLVDGLDNNIHYFQNDEIVMTYCKD